MKLVHAAIATLSLSACASVGPRYRRPDLPLPPSYSEAESPEAIPDAWWTLFQDPSLDRLVGEALSANQDVAEAAARVEEARALAGLAQADRWPQIDLSASASRTRLSGDSA
ncbi:MAG TPA: TolC family protein, partial [Vicinamibacteria bacterium]|nr:TolC family protein [Vicinamibacteria bacterium]